MARTTKETSGSKSSSKSAKSGAVSYPVRNAKGEQVGSVDFDSSVFGAEISEALVFDTVIWQQNKRRAGTHSCLTKGEMKGGTKKPWRQKGTGRARSGTNTSPIWVGGAVAHGPKPHDYETRVPKRTRRQALAAVLSSKANNQQLVVVDGLAVNSGKTKDMVKLLETFGVTGECVAFLHSSSAKDAKQNVLASRNICGLFTLPVEGVNVYDLMRAKYIIGTKQDFIALQDSVKKRFDSSKEGQAK